MSVACSRPRSSRRCRQRSRLSSQRWCSSEVAVGIHRPADSGFAKLVVAGAGRLLGQRRQAQRPPVDGHGSGEVSGQVGADKVDTMSCAPMRALLASGREHSMTWRRARSHQGCPWRRSHSSGQPTNWTERSVKGVGSVISAPGGDRLRRIPRPSMPLLTRCTRPGHSGGLLADRIRWVWQWGRPGHGVPQAGQEVQ